MKLHWYCFVYRYGDTGVGNAYSGLEHQVGFSKTFLDEQGRLVAKRAGVESQHVLTNIIYLGHMTEAEFLGS